MKRSIHSPNESPELFENMDQLHQSKDITNEFFEPNFDFAQYFKSNNEEEIQCQSYHSSRNMIIIPSLNDSKMKKSLIKPNTTNMLNRDFEMLHNPYPTESSLADSSSNDSNMTDINKSIQPDILNGDNNVQKHYKLYPTQSSKILPNKHTYVQNKNKIKCERSMEESFDSSSNDSNMVDIKKSSNQPKPNPTKTLTNLPKKNVQNKKKRKLEILDTKMSFENLLEQILPNRDLSFIESIPIFKKWKKNFQEGILSQESLIKYLNELSRFLVYIKRKIQFQS